MKETPRRISHAFEAPVSRCTTPMPWSALDDAVDAALDWLAREAPETEIVGRGRRMELYKEVGLPENVAERFGLADMRGTHAIGHTRMATEVRRNH